jgi:integrase
MPTRALTGERWCALSCCMSRKKPDPDGKVKTWVKTPTPNLIKNASSGTYYLRGRFGAGPVRESLRTTDYQAARALLDARMNELKAAHGRGVGKLETLADALATLTAKIQADPSIMPSTRENYGWELKALGKGAKLPAKPLPELRPADMMTWWAGVAANYAPQQANHLLRWARECVELARNAGVIRRDPMKDLKRVKLSRHKRALLTPEQFDKLLVYLRERGSVELADWLAFAAYSGLRPSEMLGLDWQHIEADRILVASGKTVNISGKTRKVPIIPPMAALLADLRTRRETLGKVFRRAQRPRCDGLKAACAKLGLPHQRVYDFRHLFATQAIKAGVDVPTVSRWLGHSDGGALAMRTYVHPDDAHSVAAAAKVTF